MLTRYADTQTPLTLLLLPLSLAVSLPAEARPKEGAVVCPAGQVEVEGRCLDHEVIEVSGPPANPLPEPHGVGDIPDRKPGEGRAGGGAGVPPKPRDSAKECEKCDLEFHFCKKEADWWGKQCNDIGESHAETLCEKQLTQCNHRPIPSDTYECKLETIGGKLRRTCTGPGIYDCQQGCISGNDSGSSQSGVTFEVNIPKIGTVNAATEKTIQWNSSGGFAAMCEKMATDLKLNQCLTQASSCRSKIKQETGHRCPTE
jgi:hypothetical protein